jgi:plasmid stabilization system protein ParE
LSRRSGSNAESWRPCAARSGGPARPDIRSFAFKGYVIFFRYEGDGFEIVNVLEGHRDVIAYFRDDTI